MKKAIMMQVSGTSAWIAGVYYKKNVLFSLLQNIHIMKKYRIIVLCSREVMTEFSDFADRVVLVEYDRPQSAKVYGLIFRYNVRYFFEMSASKKQEMLGIKGSYWIPDFQHCLYPEYFSEEERRERDGSFLMHIRSHEPLILSSNAACEDMKKYYGDKENVYILPFVSYIEPEIRKLSESYLKTIREKYDLTDTPFIVVSNQFWQHKNHIVVFEAINEILKKKGNIEYKFIFTGQIRDYRNSDYYSKIKAFSERESISKVISIVGFIDRLEQLALIHLARFVIQPSLFEGWGTTLEDCKVLDKIVLLSDIPVHREQMNENCILFEPCNADELADLIIANMEKEHEDNVEKGIEQMYLDAARYSENIEKMFDV